MNIIERDNIIIDNCMYLYRIQIGYSMCVGDVGEFAKAIFTI